MLTHAVRASEVRREWYVVDAEGKVLGRLASEIARILRGKHKPIYSPHLDTGDHVIVINADKVKLTGRKAEDKKYFRHTLYPGVKSCCPSPAPRYTPNRSGSIVLSRIPESVTACLAAPMAKRIFNPE